MKISPVALARSSSSSFCASSPSTRKTASEKLHESSSHPGSSRTHEAKSSARRTASRIRERIPWAPRHRSTVHSFSARKRRPSAGPYSDSETTSSDTRRYSGTSENALRRSSGRAHQNALQSIGTNSHLCGLTTTESARSTPAADSRNSSHDQAEPAYAASTCSHVPARSHASAIAGKGSTAALD